jgi:NAD(P)-dependent dehydrogenase (short-subunit alcohol dehydrogenase family)
MLASVAQLTEQAGLGFEMAKYLAGMNPGKLIVTGASASRSHKIMLTRRQGRDAARMSSSLEAIREATGCRTIEAMSLDLNSNNSVKAFSDRIAALDRLDILIANAGLAKTSWDVKEGHEETCVRYSGDWCEVHADYEQHSDQRLRHIPHDSPPPSSA